MAETVDERLVRIEVKLDGLIHRLDATVGPTGPIADHETRLRVLERKIWTAAGAAAVLAGGASSLAALLGR